MSKEAISRGYDISDEGFLERYGGEIYASLQELKQSDTPDHLVERIWRDWAICLRMHDLANMPYEEYLRSREWSEIREAVISRDGGTCTLCGSSGPLHVHHRRYDRRGFEDLTDLTTLCGGCHSEFHSN